MPSSLQAFFEPTILQLLKKQQQQQQQQKTKTRRRRSIKTPKATG